MSENTSTISFRISLPPQYIGYWVLPGSLPGAETMFSTAAKPNWIHRQTMRIFLGWQWKAAK